MARTSWKMDCIFSWFPHFFAHLTDRIISLISRETKRGRSLQVSYVSSSHLLHLIYISYILTQKQLGSARPLAALHDLLWARFNAEICDPPMHGKQGFQQPFIIICLMSLNPRGQSYVVLGASENSLKIWTLIPQSAILIWRLGIDLTEEFALTQYSRWKLKILYLQRTRTNWTRNRAERRDKAYLVDFPIFFAHLTDRIIRLMSREIRRGRSLQVSYVSSSHLLHLIYLDTKATWVCAAPSGIARSFMGTI